MSGGADARFPYNKDTGIPPSPSRENPGQVYPKSDLQSAPAESIPGTGGDREPASLMGNPYAQSEVFGNLRSALDDAISSLENEAGSAGSSSNGNTALRKLKGWRTELGAMNAGGPMGRGGTSVDTSQEGGLFTD
ncbi:hypothetical protein QCA50_008055 [Cerrena zonata]|uniref:Uncharacterized protein n=1 Tax=Cerrena zonata TaxID=2478898 RepID=A0AAW0GAG5_9APHY